MSFPSFGFLVDFIDATDKAYTLGGRIKNDINNYITKKENNKIKEELEKMRNLTGEIDMVLTELKLNLERIPKDEGSEFFDNYKNDFTKVYERIRTMSSQIKQISKNLYFHKYPDFRDTMMSKSLPYWELKDPTQPPSDFMMFSRYVRNENEITRKALIHLNAHLEDHFE